MASSLNSFIPEPGWVEHDPQAILNSQIEALRAAVSKAGIEVRDIAAIGITNQRETTLLLGAGKWAAAV